MSKQTFEPVNLQVNWREYQFQGATELQLATLEKKVPYLLVPHPRVQTSGRSPNEPLLGVMAFWQGKPVGLVLTEKQDDQQGLIVCWSVIKSQHGFKLGQKLIRQIQRLAKSNGINNLTLSFRQDSPFHQQITRTLHHLDWETPEKKLILYKFTPELFMQMAWCQHMKLSAQFEIFSWDTLAEQDKQQILNRQKQSDWYPDALSPHFDKPDFEAAISLGLRLQGVVVGWLIAHRVHADVIEYSCLFVSPELQVLGRGIHLIVEAIKRQHSLGVERAIFQVQAENSAMLSFVERRMAESITAKTSRWFSKKLLA